MPTERNSKRNQRPKRASRGTFAPGSTGNPNGRPRRQRPPIHDRQVRTDFFDAAHQEITITENGVRRKMTRIRALFDLEFAEALKGHSPSRKHLLTLYRLFSAAEEKQQAYFMEMMLRAEEYDEREAKNNPMTEEQRAEKERRRLEFLKQLGLPDLRAPKHDERE